MLRGITMTNQIALPVSVPADQIARKKTLGSAIELCAEAAGFDLDKTLALELGVDKGQFSRWLSGQEGIHWVKFEKLMDACGNDAPLLWMLHQRGYELGSLHKRESDTERRLRVAQEELATERAARLAVEESMRRILTGGK
jgi:transcriptional regulator with XRE-family HTH domain